MAKKSYQVIEEYSKQKHDVFLTKLQSKCIGLLKKGDVFEPKNLINENVDLLSTFTAKDKHHASSNTVFNTLKIAREIGIIKEYAEHSIQFDDFIKQESISYFADQLRGSKNKNLKEKRKLVSTKKDYLYRVY